MSSSVKPETAAGAVDFQALSKSVSEDLLAMVETRFKDSKIGNDIRGLATQYARALKQGLGPARQGYLLTIEIIALAARLGSSTPDDTEKYLLRTKTISESLLPEVKKIEEDTQALRRGMIALTEKLPKKPDGNNAKRLIGNVNEHVNTILQWWEWIKLQTTEGKPSRQETATDATAMDLALYVQTINGGWELLRTQFADYTQFVSGLEDRYPQLFKEGISEPLPGTPQGKKGKGQSAGKGNGKKQAQTGRVQNSGKAVPPKQGANKINDQGSKSKKTAGQDQIGKGKKAKPVQPKRTSSPQKNNADAPAKATQPKVKRQPHATCCLIM